MQVRTQRIRRIAATGCVAAALALASCDEPLRDLTGPSPNLTPTFDSIRQEIFQTTDLAGRTSCITCHTNAGGRFPAGNLNLATDPYAALVNTTSTGRRDLVRVTPGDPEGSYLIHKLEGRSGIVGLRMPINGPPYLTSGQIRVIKRWIEIGAPR
jgi:hypothetical protein